MGKRIGMLAWIAVALACGPDNVISEKEMPDEDVVEAPRIPEVSYVGGCAALLDDVVWRCLGESVGPEKPPQLRLWVDGEAPELSIEVRLEDKLIDHERKPCLDSDTCGDTGLLVTVPLQDEGALELRIEGQIALELDVELTPVEIIEARQSI